MRAVVTGRNSEDQYLAFVVKRNTFKRVGNCRKAEFLNGPFEEVEVSVGIIKAGDSKVVVNADKEKAAIGVGKRYNLANNFFGVIYF